MYRDLLSSLAVLVTDASLDADQLRMQLQALIASHQQRKPPTRAQLVRDHLIEEISPVRSLLPALTILPWQATADHPVLAALQLLQGLYAHDVKELTIATSIEFGKVWKTLLADSDRGRALRAFEVATLLALRRALRNGTVWIDHSMAFPSGESLFMSAAQWQQQRRAYYRRLSLPKQAEAFLEPLIERSQAGVAAVARAAEAGELWIDDSSGNSGCFYRHFWQQKGGNPFTSVSELEVTINEYIAAHNANPKPFIWTAKASDILAKVTRQSGLKLSTLLNDALVGLGVGGTVGGLVGALVGMGIPE